MPGGNWDNFKLIRLRWPSSYIPRDHRQLIGAGRNDRRCGAGTASAAAGGRMPECDLRNSHRIARRSTAIFIWATVIVITIANANLSLYARSRPPSVAALGVRRRRSRSLDPVAVTSAFGFGATICSRVWPPLPESAPLRIDGDGDHRANEQKDRAPMIAPADSPTSASPAPAAEKAVDPLGESTCMSAACAFPEDRRAAREPAGISLPLAERPLPGMRNAHRARCDGRVKR